MNYVKKSCGSIYILLWKYTQLLASKEFKDNNAIESENTINFLDSVRWLVSQRKTEELFMITQAYVAK